MAPVMGAVPEVPDVVTLRMIVMVTEIPEDKNIVVTASSVLVPETVISPPVLVPLMI